LSLRSLVPEPASWPLKFFRNFIMPLVISIILIMSYQRFLELKPSPVVDEAGSRVAMPVQETAPRDESPLNKEIDFIDTAAVEDVQTSDIETSYGHLEFSSQGASLRSVEYKRVVDGHSIVLTTITPPAEFEKEKSVFLVALDRPTPYLYKLVDRVDTADSVELLYQAPFNQGLIEKRFVVYKDKYQIDLTLTLKLNSSFDGVVQPRIFFSTPLLADSTKSEHVAGIVEEHNQKVVKIEKSRDPRGLSDNFWRTPTLFGGQDRYFAYVMINDAARFTQRAFFKVDVDSLHPILQGPAVKKESSWTLSFYMGPKEHAPMLVVDQRLEELLNYGWLGIVAKPMLAFMKWINGYVKNFGIAIILFTILLRLLMLPLTIRGAKGGEKAREMQKKLQYIKQRYKDDPQALEREQAELYQKYGLAGLGGLGSGCLPLLLQLPIFFAMNRVLSSSIELYQAPFLWITDLSAKDPYYILPLLVALSMVLTTWQASDAQQRISGLIMAAIFGAIAMGFSAGLSLYLFVSTTVGVLQMYVQKERKA
jgi:YidC/Oxa1 family membrane protein insertase